MNPTTTDETTVSVFDFRQTIDTALCQYTSFQAGCPDRLADAIRYSLLAPGKRLRPHLVLLAAKACGCDIQVALPAACAVEMIHAYSLIHDDLPAMDDDDLRRGQPTCHKQFDEATAILAGDALQARAFEILASDIRPSEVAGACCVELARAAGATQMVGGQADDLAAEDNGGDLDELESIHRRKTGAMLTVSVRLGGLVADANDEQMERLTDYGRNLGLAFQIVDDLLDYAGSEASLGKRIGKDTERGKLTFPGMLGVEASRRRAVELAEKACELVTPFGDAADGLQRLARFVVGRNY